MTEYIVGKVSNNEKVSSNCVYVKSKKLDYLEVNYNGKIGIFKVFEDISIEQNQICFNTFQRTLLNSALGTKINAIPMSNGLMKSLNSITFLASNLYPKNNRVIEITDEVIDMIKEDLVGIPIQSNLKLIGYQKKLSLVPIDLDISVINSIITLETEIKIISTDKTIIIETSDTKEFFGEVQDLIKKLEC